MIRCCKINDIQCLMTTVNSELINLCEWFRANKLSLNIKKTNYMMFGRKGKKFNDASFSININGVNIERVHNTKFLGCYVDEELNWKYHTAQISAKI